MRRVVTVTVAIAMVLGLSACGADGSTSAPPAPGAAVADVTLPLIGGGELDASVLDRGPLALWFWAPG